ncbi:hypothetical protein BKA07_002033 [Brevibacterium marinum]|uniref:Uncharacterized protein n=1 Tax=Brevibacterium marinum TaxID=418643 RepID=A0A846S1S3_9MICO|nr:hypothetical protein [Brevibacterium marinum]
MMVLDQDLIRCLTITTAAAVIVKYLPRASLNFDFRSQP